MTLDDYDDDYEMPDDAPFVGLMRDSVRQIIGKIERGERLMVAEAMFLDGLLKHPKAKLIFQGVRNEQGK